MLPKFRIPLVTVCAFLLGTWVFLARPEGADLVKYSPPASATTGDNVVLQWNGALLEAVRRSRFAPMLTARALAVVHTAMYDAWAAYQPTALFVHAPESMRRTPDQRTPQAVDAAMSMAAHRTLTDLFPSHRSTLFDVLMLELGLNPADVSSDPVTPVGVGNLAAISVLALRHADGSNQLGDLNGGAPYSDYTGYRPVNSPDALIDPNRWQPLQGASGPQTFLAPHWSRVFPFALSAADQFRPGAPAQYPSNGYSREVEAIRLASAHLTDRDKMIAEYWSDGPATETPAGHWSLLAQWVSRRDARTADQDVVMFFALANSLLDASIAVWDAKLTYDYIRPVSAVRFLYGGSLIEAWGGPGRGTTLIPAHQFQSYIATPPFPEYTSGHSAFSAAAAEILKLSTGSPHFGASVVFSAGVSRIEPGVVPASEITLEWRTFDDAADQAGLSRRLGGIHFRQGDLQSREMGRHVARQVWAKTRELLKGH